MSLERWDVVLRILSGPLSFQGDQVLRGPVVRIGSNPGPGGLRLEGYRGLDDRQAVISAYDGGTVAIAPVGTNQVRVAEHENVHWEEVQVLRQPAYLSPGDAFHLGPPGRGVTAIFVEARRLGQWEQGRIYSEAADAAPEFQDSLVERLDTAGGRPAWFIPAVLATGLAAAGVVLASILPDLLNPVPMLGPVDAGEAYYTRVDVLTLPPLSPELRTGLNEPIRDFVMAPNAEAARWPELAEDPTAWDPVFVDWVSKSVAAHGRARSFWNRLELVREDYAFVVDELRRNDLPEVFAAIPYQESRYLRDNTSPVCAKGWWQFMPETALRAGLVVEECMLRGRNYPWTPDQLVPPYNVMKNAPYVERDASDNPSCLIKSCARDDRTDPASSTAGAIRLLGEAWDDETLANSGGAVQITILTHNAGYHDERFDQRRRVTNLLPAYKEHLKRLKLKEDPFFYGANIRCLGDEYADIRRSNETCGGVLPNQTQHYAYNIVAQHILAVCYYARNYPREPAFEPWARYDQTYCAEIQVPTRDNAQRWGGR